MAQLNLRLLVIFLSLLSISESAETMAYIKTSCKNTLYPRLCFQCLAKFSNSNIKNPQQLAQISLSVSLSKALSTRAYLLKLANQLNAMKNNKGYLVVQDCLRQINDSVDQLGQSIKELPRSNRNAAINDDFLWHISNVETWVTTALTDVSTCMDSFPGHRMSKLKASIKVRALNVAEVTSNALALFQGYTAKYKAAAVARAINKP